MKLSLLHQQIGKSARTRSTKTSADAPQSSKVMRKGPKSTKSQAKRQKTTAPPPPPLGSPIHVESSPSSPEVQTKETSADVHEHTADLVGSIIASVVSSIQTSTTPPQGKVMSIKLLPMDLFFQLITIIIIFQLTLIHRQLQPINPWFHQH